ncbi:MAG: hypothetical protein K5685_13985, partial [Bacteroidales bacterium]|nr:hypothetical protein [Bacteroidales bacterium]
MDIRKMKKEATLYYIEGEENATKIVYDDGTDNVETELEQVSDNVETELEQVSDNVETEYGQCTDNVQTVSVQRQDRNKTDIARSSKRPIETHYSVFKEYSDVVKLLVSRKFVRLSTSNAYSSIEDLPLSRAPIDLTTAVNKKGFPVTRDDLAKIYTAANVCLRVPKWKVWTILIFAICVTIYGTNVFNSLAQKQNSTTEKSTVLPAAFPENDALDIAIREWEHSTGKKIYPAGRKALERASV